LKTGCSKRKNVAEAEKRWCWVLGAAVSGCWVLGCWGYWVLLLLGAGCSDSGTRILKMML
jgi:hypothetical protein